MATITDDDLDELLDDVLGKITDELIQTESAAGTLSFGGALTRMVMYKRAVAGVL